MQSAIDFTTLDAVIISHAHPDHCIDIFGFFYAYRFGGQSRPAIPTLVPEGLVERLRAFLGDPDHPIGESLDFRIQADGDSASIGEIGFDFAVTDHPVPTLAVRAQASNGRVLAYSADTGPEGDWSRVATDVDLFVCEATYQGSVAEKPWSHHLTAGEAGGIARARGVKDLMLTHLWPVLDPDRSLQEAEETYGKPVKLAVPGAAYKV